MVGVLQNREAAEDLPRSEHMAADRTDHSFEPESICVRVIAPGACELTQADGHHLEKTAFNAPNKICVPFYAANQHHTIGIVGVAVHENFNAFGCSPKRNHIERTHYRTAHCLLCNSVMRQHP